MADKPAARAMSHAALLPCVSCSTGLLGRVWVCCNCQPCSPLSMKMIRGGRLVLELALALTLTLVLVLRE